MKRVEFDECFEQLNKRPREVLKLFLAGKTEIEIAEKFDYKIDVDETTGEKKGSSTVRKHLSNACKVFGFTNGEGEHYSYRDSLVEEFIIHQPNSVAPQLQEFYGGRQPTPEYPGRPVSLNSPFYLQPPDIEKQCFQQIIQPNALIRIKAARKKGKTSLISRILEEARQKGYRTVYLNFRQVEESCFEKLDLFLQWFCEEISEELELEFQFEAWEKRRTGVMTKCKRYFKKNILNQTDKPLVLAMDEVEKILDYPTIAGDFFALLRGWYEEQNDPETWGKLRQIVCYSTDNYIDMDINRSPFNVGLAIQLPMLTNTQVKQLAQKYGQTWTLEAVEPLMKLLGGHPYLVQLTLYNILENNETLDSILKSATTTTSIYRNHLQYLWDKLENSQLLEPLKQILTSDSEIDLSDEVKYKLEGLGVVKLEQNKVKPSCELYSRYFSERLEFHL